MPNKTLVDRPEPGSSSEAFFLKYMRINEEMLERYVRYPQTLSEEECSEVQTLVKESELARQIVAFYEDYYSELDELDRGESEALKSFVERILKTIQADPGNNLED